MTRAALVLALACAACGDANLDAVAPFWPCGDRVCVAPEQCLTYRDAETGAAYEACARPCIEGELADDGRRYCEITPTASKGSIDHE